MQTKIKKNKNSRKQETITEIKTAGIFILLLYTGNKLFIKSPFLLKMLSKAYFHEIDELVS